MQISKVITLLKKKSLKCLKTNHKTENCIECYKCKKAGHLEENCLACAFCLKSIHPLDKCFKKINDETLKDSSDKNDRPLKEHPSKGNPPI